MKKNLLFFIFMFMSVATPAAFAGHDHGGSQDSADKHRHIVRQMNRKSTRPNFS